MPFDKNTMLAAAEKMLLRRSWYNRASDDDKSVYLDTLVHFSAQEWKAALMAYETLQTPKWKTIDGVKTLHLLSWQEIADTQKGLSQLDMIMLIRANQLEKAL